MNIRPIRLLRDKDVAAFRRLAADALDSWRADWAPGAALAVEARAASQDASAQAHASAPWRQHAAQAGLQVWVCVAPGFERALERVLFDIGDGTAQRHKESALAGALAREACDALLEALLAALGAGRETVATDMEALRAQFRQGGDAVSLTVEAGGKILRVVAPVALMPREQAPTATAGAAPERVLEAIRGQEVTLRLCVGEAELTLGHLRTLRVGDIVALQSRIGDALPVYGPQDGQPVCNAYLGCADGFKAIELTKA